MTRSCPARLQAAPVPGRPDGLFLDEAAALLFRPPTGHAGTKARLMEARAVLQDLARSLSAEAENLEAQLYDAWLRVECARALGDEALLRAQRQAWAVLLAQAQEAIATPATRAA